MELLVILFGLLMILLFQAIILRWACQLCGVEPPDHGWAILTLFVNIVVATTVQAAIFWVYASGNLAAAQNPQAVAIPTLISLPVWLVLSVGIYSTMLGTSLGRAFLILLVNQLIYLMCCCLPGLVLSGLGHRPVGQ